MIRSDEIELNRTMQSVSRRLAARNPFRENRCDYCHAHENQSEHNNGCLYALACKVRDILNGDVA